jgi:hypothetical protein
MAISLEHPASWCWARYRFDGSGAGGVALRPIVVTMRAGAAVRSSMNRKGFG